MVRVPEKWWNVYNGESVNQIQSEDPPQSPVGGRVTGSFATRNAAEQAAAADPPA